MENIILRTILLSVFAYFLALFLVKIMGGKIISQMTFFDFIIAVTMGSIISSLVLDPNGPSAGITLLITFTALTIIMGLSYIKNMKISKLINSEPIIVIDKGQIVNKNMEKIRLTLSDLLMLLRQKNYFNIGDVEYAVMETNGQLSVLAKAEKQPATVADLNLYTSYKGLTRDLIMDGNILEENLNSAGIKEFDFLNQLKSYGVNNVKNVFYAGLDSTGNLYLSKKQNDPEYEGQYGID